MDNKIPPLFQKGRCKLGLKEIQKSKNDSFSCKYTHFSLYNSFEAKQFYPLF